MKAIVAFIFATFLIFSSSRPARADTSIGDGGAWLLWVSGAAVTGFSLLSITFGEGSEWLGIAGMAVGGTLATYSAVKNVEDEGFFIGSGVFIAVVGAANFFVTKDRRSDSDLHGLHVAPTVSPGMRSAGLQLSYNW